MTSFVVWGMSCCLCSMPVSAASWEMPADKIIQMSHDPVWQALLHTHDGTPYVKDAGFLLSWPAFSVEKELDANITQLQNVQTHTAYICKFPARAQWLQQQLNLPSLDFSVCSEFQDYLQHVPADNVQLVYVSENITQPSSIMGHVFLDLTGTRENGLPVAHAVSFFTDAHTANIPKLLFDTMVVGKKGYFSLTPLDEKIERYHHQEQRNVWVYDLNLTEDQKQRILYHAWELKTAPLKYFFNKYNCATLTYFMLATTGNEQLSPSFNGAMSPLDVAKSVEAAHLVERKTLLPANKSVIRMLSLGQSSGWTEQVKAAVLQHNIPTLVSSAASDEDRYLRYQVAKHYKDLLIDQNTLSTPADTSVLDLQFDQAKRAVPSYVVDLSQYKNPLKSHGDSQLSVGAGVDRHHNVLHVDYVVAGHHLEDDNSQFANESELLLGNIGANVDVTRQRFSLDYLKLYSMATYIPYDTLTGGTSGQFQISYAPMINANLKRTHQLQLGGGVGITQQLLPSVETFMQGSAVLHVGIQQQGIDLSPAVGAIVHEKWGLKSIVQYEPHVDTVNLGRLYQHVKLIQSKQMNNQYSLNFFADYYKNSQRIESSYFLMLRHYF